MTPARCEKCGHEGALPPDDPLTGEKRFECPICGEPSLAPVDEAAPPSRTTFLGKPVETIFKPEGPRPRAFVAGSIADLRALYQTTIAVVRAGLATALLSLLVLAPIALLIVVTCARAGLLRDWWIEIPFVLLALALLLAGPLAAFGSAAMGEKPALRATLGRACRRAPLLALTIGAALLLLAAAICALTVVAGSMASGVHGRSSSENSDIAFALIVSGALLVFLGGIVSAFYLRLILLAHILAVVGEPGKTLKAFAKIARLTRGRLVLLAAVAVGPIVIMAAASPTPPARDLAVKWLGPDGALGLAVGAGVLGGTTAVLLGSAMLAAALAVILATPIEERTP